VNRCVFVGHAHNKPKKQFKKTIYKQRNTLKLQMNGTWKKPYLTIEIAIWKSFQLSHIYTKQKKGGNTNLKS
jgi:hypothetical protein